MTDKQIKDGIDVSQCECYSIEDNSCNDTLSGSCIKEKCQIFRLLQTIKAKEQECETLASQLDFEVQKKECLEQECEELKKKNYELTEEVSIDRALFAEIDQLKAELTRANCQIADGEILQCDMREVIEELKAENDRLMILKDKTYFKLKEEYLQHLEQLKAELEAEKNWHKTADEISKTNSEYTAKLKQTLTEIKEIATCPKKIETTFNINNWIEIRSNILQKISDLEV